VKTEAVTGTLRNRKLDAEAGTEEAGNRNFRKLDEESGT
jgi:hypothetical protein